MDVEKDEFIIFLNLSLYIMKEHLDAVILIQSMSRLGGTEIVALNLMKALRERGVSAAILSVEEYHGNEKYVLCPSKEERQRYGITKSGFLEKIGFPTKKIYAVRPYLNDFCGCYNVKCLINFTYENLVILPYDADLKTIGVYHWSIIGYEKSLFDIAKSKRFPFSLISRLILKRKYKNIHKYIGHTDYAIALTDNGAKEINHISPNSKVLVIPNFLPYNQMHDSVSYINNLKAVYVGRLSREKGVYHLVDIWEKVADKLDDVTLSIYGEGDERRNLERIIEQRKIPRIEFKGFERDADKIYRNADILLCTSETEGFGMVLIEAMYHGVVPVAFDCPVSPKELIADAGVTVECFDIDKYVEEVVSLFSDNDRRASLQEKGLKRAADFYKSKVIDKWMRLIN